MTNRKFTDVFGVLNLPKDIMNPLNQAKIKDLSLDKARRNMHIELSLPKIINENTLFQLEQALLNAYPACREIAVECEYTDVRGGPSELIDSYWENLLINLSRRSPVSHSVIFQSRHQFSDGILSIHIGKNSSYILKRNETDRFISDLLKMRFGLSISVHFIENTTVKRRDDTEMVRDAVKTIISSRMSETKNITSTPEPENKAKKYSKEEFQKIKDKKRVKHAKVKASVIDGIISRLSEEQEKDDEILIDGIIFRTDTRILKSGLVLVVMDITDNTGSVTAKLFIDREKHDKELNKLISTGSSVRILGKFELDEFTNELHLMVLEISRGEFKPSQRTDTAEHKRVELHLHTTMSAKDAVTPIKDYIEAAAKWGHKAIGVTDHGVVQAFPDAMKYGKANNIKILYGVEAYVINDLAAIVRLPGGKKIADETFVVFDIETTGLKKEINTIIEIGAVKIKDGKIADTFSELITPNEPLDAEIVKLTGITDEMLAGKADIREILPRFLEFAGESVLVAHNAQFDVGFLRNEARKQGLVSHNTTLCTLELYRALYPEQHRHGLAAAVEFFDIKLDNHHRAGDDAMATAQVFIKLCENLKERNISNLRELNALTALSENAKLKSYHAVIYAKNQTGLRNLYRLISDSHVKHYFKQPRMPKSEIEKLREGLIIGSACESGELFQAILDSEPDEYVMELAEFYDYFEIQPVANNMFLLRQNRELTTDSLKDFNKKIAEYAERFGKPIVAACDAHFLNPEDEIYRRIIMAGHGFTDTDAPLPLFYRTTDEMLADFQYLGEDKAFDAVVTNPNNIADSIDSLVPVPNGTFPPVIEGSEELITEITVKKAKEIYGEQLPLVVEARLNRELDSIIKNGFAVMYVIAQKLVSRSMADGYLVGSRGSVGSSLVATMADITEVNPLPPHYYCKKCKYSEFESERVKAYAGGSGCDMPDAVCPNCKSPLSKEGHDIPFETFLGFDGDKEPDIDLNFSGEYQLRAHAYAQELFGKDYVFKAGTINTIAEKTAFGFVKKYLEERNTDAKTAEISWLALGCTGVKKTTGQHPGGLMVLPKGHEIYEFCPIQYPADDSSKEVTTTHFDYHSIEGRLLKLDLLGHDVPTIIKHLHDATGIDPRTVDIGDTKLMSLFTSPKALGVTDEQINCKTGSLGLPEFGTEFVRQMLMETKPSSFSDLVKISGFSHGTDVWRNNAQDIIKEGIATLKETIPTRDDIMLYLISMGVEKKTAFTIMENVRKGKGLSAKFEEVMREAGVPEWYIKSCNTIKYLFPKGHAVAYVMMTVRIAYFKIYHPEAFYAATFSVKSAEMDYESMCRGLATARGELNRLQALGVKISGKDKGVLSIYELLCEMYIRGIKFAKLDLYRSHASLFQVTPEGILPPLCTVSGLGGNAAKSIVEARGDGEFYSVEDFKERSKVTKSVIELLKGMGVFEGMPESEQLSLF